MSAKVKGIDDASGYFQRVRRSAEDFSVLGGLIADDLLLSTRQRFYEERDANGKKWKGYEKSTLISKQRKGIAPRMLKLSNTLLDSFESEVTAHSIIIGTEVPYAPHHQFGVPANNLASRQFLGLSDDDEKTIVDRMVRYYEEL